MVVAVSILLQKETCYSLTNRLRTYVYQGCNSQAEALGLASNEALNEDSTFHISSFNAIEVTPPPKDNSEESAELRTTAVKSPLRKFLRNFF
jgi:hypothetical protein